MFDCMKFTKSNDYRSSGSLPCSRWAHCARLFIALQTMLAINAIQAAEPRLAAASCDHIVGHFRVASGSEMRGEVLQAMHATSAGFTDSEIRIESVAYQGLKIWIKSGSTGVMPTSTSNPSVVLHYGTDIECKDRSIHVLQPVDSSRSIDGEWYEGKSTIGFSVDASGQFVATVNFKGKQRTTLYSYDSARVSIPKWGTGRSQVDTVAFDKYVARATIPRPSAAERIATEGRSAAKVRHEDDARQLFNHSMLGRVRLGWVESQGDSVVTTFTASSAEDMQALQDRLQAASIRYEVKTKPIWTNNSYYMRLFVWPK
jgi:hypothetical protein